MPIKWRLAEVLAGREMTPYGLAQATGLTVPTCYELVKPDYRPGRIDTGTLAKVCAALKCQPGDLLTFVPDKAKKG